jgi:RHS repeat-associated protein
MTSIVEFLATTPLPCSGGVGGLLAVHTSPLPLGEGQGEGRTVFPFYDANGNITEYVDVSGTIRAHYTFDAFGNTIAQSGDLASIFSHRFSTKYADDETGLYYYGYRYYSPELGRWINRDPIKEEGGINLYSFVNNQIHIYDVLGLTWKPWCCEDECDIPDKRSNFKVLDYYLGPVSPLQNMEIDDALEWASVMADVPTALNRFELLKFLLGRINIGFPTRDVAEFYRNAILNGLPWQAYLLFEVDVCVKDTCCLIFSQNKEKTYRGFEILKLENLGMMGSFPPGTSKDVIPIRTQLIVQKQVERQVLGKTGTGGLFL